MQNKEDLVWCTITRTVNLGNYSNVKIEAGMSQTWEKPNAPIKLMDFICDEVFKVIKDKSKKYKKELKKSSKPDLATERIKKPWVHGTPPKKKANKFEDDSFPGDNPND